MSKIGNLKLAESQKQLKQVQREQDAAHTFAHRLDTHDLKNKGGKAPKIVGGDENKSSHGTIYQGKMKRNETATNAGKPKTRTLFQKQIAANPALFDGRE